MRSAPGASGVREGDPLLPKDVLVGGRAAAPEQAPAPPLLLRRLWLQHGTLACDLPCQAPISGDSLLIDWMAVSWPGTYVSVAMLGVLFTFFR